MIYLDFFSILPVYLYMKLMPTIDLIFEFLNEFLITTWGIFYMLHVHYRFYSSYRPCTLIIILTLSRPPEFNSFKPFHCYTK